MLSPKQQQIYDFLVAFKKENKRCAGVADVRREFGFAHYSGVQCHFEALQKKGYIKKAYRGFYQLVKPKVERQ
jgi:SOS-response transcriptional repressor LexA